MVAQTRLGQILADEGRTQNWLAVQVSARLGRPILRQQVNGWVSGAHLPKRATRAAIADALHRQVDDVFPPQPQEIAA